jgi:hypothetical protein
MRERKKKRKLDASSSLASARDQRDEKEGEEK